MNRSPFSRLSRRCPALQGRPRQGSGRASRAAAAAIAASALVLLAGADVLAQDPPPASGETEARTAPLPYDEALEEGRYLEAWMWASDPSNLPEGLPEPAADGFQAQMEAWLYSMMGRHWRAYERGTAISRNPPVPDTLEIPPYYLGLEAVDAVEAIREAASGRRVVILNEAHHDARHRAFAGRLIEGLAADGFTHFAAETFSTAEAIDRIRETGIPEQEMGFYSSEPVFGDLVRRALALGLEPVRYEILPGQRCPGECPPAEQIRTRERAQAANLAAVLEADPQARLFVLAGYSHVDEAPDVDGDGTLDGWMAAELTARTGIDPLTVDQETGSGYGVLRTPPVHARFVQAYDIAVPTAFREADGDWFTEPQTRSVDMLVVHPPLAEGPGGRPDWLAMGGYRQIAVVDAEVIPDTRPLLVQAFVDGEPRDRAIPMDQYLLEAGEGGDVTLMVPPGRYTLVFQRAYADDEVYGQLIRR